MEKFKVFTVIIISFFLSLNMFMAKVSPKKTIQFIKINSVCIGPVIAWAWALTAVFLILAALIILIDILRRWFRE